MLLFSICLLVVFGISLFTFAKLRQRPVSGRSVFAAPPADWPDVPVGDLSLFKREGLINAAMPKSASRRTRRFRSFAETQDFVVDLMERANGPLPEVALRLSDDEGPDWTDVTLDGHLVAHVQTSALTANRVR